MAIVSGYAYTFQGKPADWRASSDEDWEIEAHSAAPRAKFLGLRTIDGVTCTVWQKSPAVILAQTATTAKPPKGLR